MDALIFYAFALIIVVSAGVVVFSKNLVRAVFSLLFTFFGVAGLYVFLHADFVAAVQVLVYIGGTLVLLLFGVMLTQRIKDVYLRADSYRLGPSLIGVGLVFASFCMVIFQTNWAQPNGQVASEPTTEAIGELLLGHYLLPFEVASILLLAALVGGAFLARRRI